MSEEPKDTAESLASGEREVEVEVSSESSLGDGLSTESVSSIVDLDELPTDDVLEELKAEAKENFDKYLRALADLENVKKRAARERADLLKYANENLARDVLEVVDNLERAVAQKTTGSSEEIMAGVKLVLDRFLSILEGYAVKGESSVGMQFDPNKHDALASVPTADAAPGTIIEELKKLYYYKDKVLRHGQVVVAATLPTMAAGSSGQEPTPEPQ